MGKIFSFNGRIKRTEYAISFITYWVAYVLIRMLQDQGGAYGLFGLLIIPVIWFLWAQGAKRCHDLNRNGWWQIIPFYFFVLIFSEGDYGPNQYNTDYEVFYGAEDYERPYDAESLAPNADTNVEQ